MPGRTGIAPHLSFRRGRRRRRASSAMNGRRAHAHVRPKRCSSSVCAGAIARGRGARSAIERRDRRENREKTRKRGRGSGRYSLVAVGLPHHHGVGVGGLAGGDHGGLVEDGGDSGESGHFDVRIKSARASARASLSSRRRGFRDSSHLLKKAGRFLTERHTIFPVWRALSARLKSILFARGSQRTRLKVHKRKNLQCFRVFRRSKAIGRTGLLR